MQTKLEPPGGGSSHQRGGRNSTSRYLPGRDAPRRDARTGDVVLRAGGGPGRHVRGVVVRRPERRADRRRRLGRRRAAPSFEQRERVRVRAAGCSRAQRRVRPRGRHGDAVRGTSQRAGHAEDRELPGLARARSPGPRAAERDARVHDGPRAATRTTGPTWRSENCPGYGCRGAGLHERALRRRQPRHRGTSSRTSATCGSTPGAAGADGSARRPARPPRPPRSACTGPRSRCATTSTPSSTSPPPGSLTTRRRADGRPRHRRSRPPTSAAGSRRPCLRSTGSPRSTNGSAAPAVHRGRCPASSRASGTL